MNPIERLRQVFRKEPTPIVPEPKTDKRVNTLHNKRVLKELARVIAGEPKEFHYYSRLQLLELDLETARKVGIKPDSPFFILRVYGEDDKDLGAVCHIGKEIKAPYYDAENYCGGIQVYRTTTLSGVDTNVADTMASIKHFPSPLPYMEISPIEDFSHWFAKVNVGKMLFPNDDEEANYDSVTPQEIVGVCFEHDEEVSRGIVVELTDEKSNIHYVDGLLVPICSLDNHPEYYDRAKYIFEVYDKGEIKFRTIAQLIADKENSPTTI